MAGSAAAGLHPTLTGREVELVVEDGDVGQAELVEAHRLADRLAAVVHIGRRLEQQDALEPDRARADQPWK